MTEELPVGGYEAERLSEEAGNGWDELIDLGRGSGEEVGYDEEEG